MDAVAPTVFATENSTSNFLSTNQGYESITSESSPSGGMSTDHDNNNNQTYSFDDFHEDVGVSYLDETTEPDFDDSTFETVKGGVGTPPENQSEVILRSENNPDRVKSVSYDNEDVDEYGTARADGVNDSGDNSHDQNYSHEGASILKPGPYFAKYIITEAKKTPLPPTTFPITNPTISKRTKSRSSKPTSAFINKPPQAPKAFGISGLRSYSSLSDLSTAIEETPSSSTKTNLTAEISNENVPAYSLTLATTSTSMENSKSIISSPPKSSEGDQSCAIDLSSKSSQLDELYKSCQSDDLCSSQKSADIPQPVDLSCKSPLDLRVNKTPKRCSLSSLESPRAITNYLIPNNSLLNDSFHGISDRPFFSPRSRSQIPCIQSSDNNDSTLNQTLTIDDDTERDILSNSSRMLNRTFDITEAHDFMMKPIEPQEQIDEVTIKHTQPVNDLIAHEIRTTIRDWITPTNEPINTCSTSPSASGAKRSSNACSDELNDNKYSIHSLQNNQTFAITERSIAEIQTKQNNVDKQPNEEDILIDVESDSLLYDSTPTPIEVESDLAHVNHGAPASRFLSTLFEVSNENDPSFIPPVTSAHTPRSPLPNRNMFEGLYVSTIHASPSEDLPPNANQSMFSIDNFGYAHTPAPNTRPSVQRTSTRNNLVESRPANGANGVSSPSNNHYIEQSTIMFQDSQVVPERSRLGSSMVSNPPTPDITCHLIATRPVAFPTSHVGGSSTPNQLQLSPRSKRKRNSDDSPRTRLLKKRAIANQDEDSLLNTAFHSQLQEVVQDADKDKKKYKKSILKKLNSLSAFPRICTKTSTDSILSSSSRISNKTVAINQTMQKSEHKSQKHDHRRKQSKENILKKLVRCMSHRNNISSNFPQLEQEKECNVGSLPLDMRTMKNSVNTIGTNRHQCDSDAPGNNNSQPMFPRNVQEVYRFCENSEQTLHPLHGGNKFVANAGTNTRSFDVHYHDYLAHDKILSLKKTSNQDKFLDPNSIPMQNLKSLTHRRHSTSTLSSNLGPNTPATTTTPTTYNNQYTFDGVFKIPQIPIARTKFSRVKTSRSAPELHHQNNVTPNTTQPTSKSLPLTSSTPRLLRTRASLSPRREEKDDDTSESSSDLRIQLVSFNRTALFFYCIIVL